MGWMVSAQALRHQFFDFLSEKFPSAIAEQLFDLSVDENDLPFLIDDHDGIGRCFQKSPEPCLSPFLISDIDS